MLCIGGGVRDDGSVVAKFVPPEVVAEDEGDDAGD